MSSPNRPKPGNSTADMLVSLRRKGVILWVDDGLLRYKAPRGAVSREEIERIRLSREQIVILLQGEARTNGVEPVLVRRVWSKHAPLAFSQLTYWSLHRLHANPSARQVMSVTRLLGHLDVGALQVSISRIVQRHESLRTRIVLVNGEPLQEISECLGLELEVDDLSSVEKINKEDEVERRIKRYVREPIDIAVGPLLGIKLLRLHEREHLLILALDHLISDGVSLNILLRELLTAYAQVLKDEDPALPAISIQFADFATWQRRARSVWSAKHDPYWDTHLADCQRIRLATDARFRTGTSPEWVTASFKINGDLKMAIYRWSRSRRTTIVMSVFTAYAAFILRWYGVADIVVPYTIDGRLRPEVESTIGYFGSILYLRVILFDNDTFLDLMDRVLNEYCEAYTHSNYFATKTPLPEFAWNPGFNWLPMMPKTEIINVGGSSDVLMCRPTIMPPVVPAHVWDTEPIVQFLDSGDEIIGSIYSPADAYSMETMKRFARNLLNVLETMLSNPDKELKDIVLLQ